MRIRVGLVVVAACAVGGCNAILGLDRTHRAGGDDAARGIDGAPDAVPADANPNDVDGDGVANLADDCPTVYNPDQADEDGDMFGDVCDDCPEIYDAPQSDMMEVQSGGVADGIGDLCDPNPTVGGDERVLFEPFNDPSHLATWATPVGTWTISGGALHQSDSTAHDALAYVDRLLSPTKVVVEAKLETVPTLGTGELRAGVWVLQPASAPLGDGHMPDGYLCSIYEPQPNVNGEDVQLSAIAGDLTYSVAQNPLPRSLTVGDPLSFTLEVSAKAPPVNCFGATVGSAAVVSIGDTKYPGGAAGVYTRDLGVAFTSVTVYSR